MIKYLTAHGIIVNIFFCISYIAILNLWVNIFYIFTIGCFCVWRGAQRYKKIMTEYWANEINEQYFHYRDSVSK